MGRKNPFMQLAHDLAEEYGNPSLPVIKMFMRDLSVIKKSGLDTGIAIEAWRQIRSSEGVSKDGERGFSVPQATLNTILKGSPSFYQQYIDMVKRDMPPVYDAASHTQYVRQHALTLKSLGYVYNGWLKADDQFSGQRLTYTEAQSLGLVPE